MKIMKNMPMGLIGALALVLMVAFNSCKEDEGVITPQFPELKEVAGQPGEILEIAFSANLDWSIQSNAAWCKFVNGDFTEATALGKAGDQTLKVQISEANWNYQTDDLAELTLTIGEKSQVIYKITRPKKMFTDMQITDGEGNVYNYESPIIVKGGEPGSPNYITINVVSDFQIGFIQEEIPDWILLDAQGDGVYKIAFKEDNSIGKNIKYSIGSEENFYLPFAVNFNGEIITANIPVCYEGMDGNYISFSPIYNSMHNVSKDGKTIIVSSGLSGTEEQIYENELPSVVVARNDDYEAVMFVQKGDYMECPGMDPIFFPSDYELNNGTNLQWINVTKDADKISFSFAENESDSDIRSALVYLLPRALYESLKDNLMVLVNEETSSSYERYVILNVLQDYKFPAAPSVSFKGVLYMDDTFIDASMMTGSDFVFPGENENEYVASIGGDLFVYGTVYLEVLEFNSDMTVSFTSGSAGLSSEIIDGKQYIKIVAKASGTVEIKKGSDVIAKCTIEVY